MNYHYKCNRKRMLSETICRLLIIKCLGKSVGRFVIQMAEKGAHLTQTLHIKPSLFDFVAQQSLDFELYPAFRRIADFLSARSQKYQIVLKYFNEVYYTGHFLLQLHYLKNFGATFSERFYGLKRVGLETLASSLTRKEILLSLFFSSVVPYLQHKLNELADKIYFDVLPYERKKRKILLLKSLIWLNQNIRVSLQILTFAQYLRYLSGKSEIVSPFLWASNLKLEYSTEQNTDNELTLRSFIPQLLRRSFEVSAFFFQFCQWWQTEKIGGLNILPVPPPPEVSQAASRFAGICPICGGKRKLETVLRVSGYVFCFRCISDYLSKHNSCPVTNLPADMTSLIRLYPPN